MRLTNVFSWSPDQAGAVYQRFEEFQKGKAPEDVKQAFGRLNVIVWEKLATNGVVTVTEGDEADLLMWTSYWQDLGDFEVVEPSTNLLDQEALARITPPAFLRK